MEQKCKHCKHSTIMYERTHCMLVCNTCGLVYDDNMFLKLK